MRNEPQVRGICCWCLAQLPSCLLPMNINRIPAASTYPLYPWALPTCRRPEVLGINTPGSCPHPRSGRSRCIHASAPWPRPPPPPPLENPKAVCTFYIISQSSAAGAAPGAHRVSLLNNILCTGGPPATS